MKRVPPRSPLFPSTTLFRSQPPRPRPPGEEGGRTRRPGVGRAAPAQPAQPPAGASAHLLPLAAWEIGEHTSELQSLRHLVCRLLLSKKKTRATAGNATHVLY